MEIKLKLNVNENRVLRRDLDKKKRKVGEEKRTNKVIWRVIVGLRGDDADNEHVD